MSEKSESRTFVVAQVESEWQATLIADVLRDNGIDAAVAGALTAQFRAEAPGYARVIVPEEQSERAGAILEKHRTETSDIDWSQVDTGAPE
ncbi:MAG: putative signal transducing protein [Planctomycetota bacterium]|jgi:hypothetical protein